MAIIRKINNCIPLCKLLKSAITPIKAENEEIPKAAALLAIPLIGPLCSGRAFVPMAKSVGKFPEIRKPITNIHTTIAAPEVTTNARKRRKAVITELKKIKLV